MTHVQTHLLSSISDKWVGRRRKSDREDSVTASSSLGGPTAAEPRDSQASKSGPANDRAWCARVGIGPQGRVEAKYHPLIKSWSQFCVWADTPIKRWPPKKLGRCLLPQRILPLPRSQGAANSPWTTPRQLSRLTEASEEDLDKAGRNSYGRKLEQGKGVPPAPRACLRDYGKSVPSFQNSDSGPSTLSGTHGARQCPLLSAWAPVLRAPPSS